MFKTGHRKTAVTVDRARLQKRQQVQVVDAQRAQVVDALPHPGQGAAEAVDVGRIAHHRLLRKPVRLRGALLVQLHQRRRPRRAQSSEVLAQRK